MGWDWGGAGGGAASGAAVGASLGGPWGAAIGGAAGGVLGGLRGVFGGGGGANRQDPRSADYLNSTAHYGNYVPVLLCGTRRVTFQVVQRRFVQVGSNRNPAAPGLLSAWSWAAWDFVLAGCIGQVDGQVAIGKLWIDDLEYLASVWEGAGLQWQPGGLTGNAITMGDDRQGGLWPVRNPGLACLASRHFTNGVLDGNYVDLAWLYLLGPLSQYQGPWLDNTGYGEGDVVTYGGKIYRSKHSANGSDPTVESDWSIASLDVFPQQINATPRYVGELSVDRAAGSLDGLPEVAMRKVVTNSILWGAGWAPERLETGLGTDGLARSGFAVYCAAKGWKVSPLIDQQTSGSDILEQLSTACDSELVPSDGKLKVLPRGEVAIGDYVPDTQAVCEFTYDDYLPQGDKWAEGEDPVQFAMTPDTQVFNVIPVQFRDRSRKDEVNTGTKPESADVNELVVVSGVARPRGERRSSPISLPCISNMPHAEAISASLARRAVYQRARWTWRAGWPFDFVDGMDIALLNDPKLGLVRFPVRILKIERDRNGKNTFTAEAYLGEVGSTVKVDMSQAA